MEKVLVTNNQYNGKYIALKSANDDTIVGSGAKPESALRKAKENGFIHPFIMYVPDKDLVQIYLCL